MLRVCAETHHSFVWWVSALPPPAKTDSEVPRASTHPTSPHLLHVRSHALLDDREGVEQVGRLDGGGRLHAGAVQLRKSRDADQPHGDDDLLLENIHGADEAGFAAGRERPALQPADAHGARAE